MKKTKQTIIIFWLRRDLRFEDNHALFEAAKVKTQILPLFIFDTNLLSRLEDKNDRRVDFIHQVLSNLQNKLTNIGRSLCVRVGRPLDIFEQLVKEYDVKSVYTTNDYEPEALKRDKEIENFLQTKSIRLYSFKDQVIFEWNEVLKANGDPYTILLLTLNCGNRSYQIKISNPTHPKSISKVLSNQNILFFQALPTLDSTTQICYSLHQRSTKTLFPTMKTSGTFHLWKVQHI